MQSRACQHAISNVAALRALIESVVSICHSVQTFLVSVTPSRLLPLCFFCGIIGARLSLATSDSAVHAPQGTPILGFHFHFTIFQTQYSPFLSDFRSSPEVQIEVEYINACTSCTVQHPAQQPLVRILHQLPEGWEEYMLVHDHACKKTTIINSCSISQSSIQVPF